MAGPAEPVRPFRPWSDQKSCYLWSKPCNFSVLVGPIIVRLRLFSNGRTNLELISPPLHGGICPPSYGGGTSAGGQSVNGGTHAGDIDLMGGPNFHRLYHKLKVLLMLSCSLHDAIHWLRFY